MARAASKGHLVISLISVLNTQIEVLNIEVKEGMNQLVLNVLPEDSSHFITIDIYNGLGNLGFSKGGKRSLLNNV